MLLCLIPDVTSLHMIYRLTHNNIFSQPQNYPMAPEIYRNCDRKGPNRNILLENAKFWPALQSPIKGRSLSTLK